MEVTTAALIRRPVGEEEEENNFHEVGYIKVFPDGEEMFISNCLIWGKIEKMEPGAGSPIFLVIDCNGTTNFVHVDKVIEELAPGITCEYSISQEEE